MFCFRNNFYSYLKIYFFSYFIVKNMSSSRRLVLPVLLSQKQFYLCFRQLHSEALKSGRKTAFGIKKDVEDKENKGWLDRVKLFTVNIFIFYYTRKD